MRKYLGRVGWLLICWAVLTPVVARAGSDSPGYAPPANEWWFPFGSTQPDRGGLFVDFGFTYFRMTNPIKDQDVAFRGFISTDSSIFGTGSQGQHVGSFDSALNTQQVSGPNGYAPGFKISVGWKFDDDTAVTASFWQQYSVKRTASAAEIPPNYNVGGFDENSFLFSPVLNATSIFSGPQKIPQGSPGALFGIWNGASEMTEQFKQWFEQYEITYRFAVYEQDNYRLSGMVGPRIATLWEGYNWRTVDVPSDGSIPSGFDVGIYNNILSQDMYGFHAGCEQEWYLGHGFAAILDLDCALFMDFAKERVSYELGVKEAGGKDKRSNNEYQIVPELAASLGLAWYPIQGVQCQIGYEFMAFFNTLSSPQPISFDLSGLNPRYTNDVNRYFDGFKASISFSF